MIFNLKKFKPVHWIYNLLHYRQLLHNRAAFKQLGMHKPLFASLSAKDFPDKTSKAWLDTGDSLIMAKSNSLFTSFDISLQQKLLHWSANGYIILENFFDDKTVLSINNEIDTMLANGKIKFENRNKLMFANHKSSLIKYITNDSRLLKILSFILGKEVIPFQTINFITGSEQRAHSDSIHMTTYPLGYLIAVWIALEDVDELNGPLLYYPGSHKLPYVLNEDFNQGETFLFTGKNDYPEYETVIEKMVEDKAYKKEIFHAKKGDAFIWHANLVHGGSPISDNTSTRKSMVIHYFAKDVIKYHEISERPSIIKN